jgi:hypothetical protein
MNVYIVFFVLIILIIVIVYVWKSRAIIITGSADFVKDLGKHPRTKSEASIIKYFEEITGHKFPTVVPKWLAWKGKHLELDGYNDKLKIAVEFSGPLHTKWYPDKEPYDKYFTRIVRDIVKKKLCKRKGVKLIVIDVTLPPQHWRDYIKSRLYDIGYLKDRPVPYIEE